MQNYGKMWIFVTSVLEEQSMMASNRVGIGVSYRPAGLHTVGRRNRFRGINSWAYSYTFTNSGSVYLGLSVDVEAPWAGEV
jgi:hypothetical protein